MINYKLSPLSGNTIELHYKFLDNTHYMNAYIHNRCEYELLGVFKEIAASFNVKLQVETEPLGYGGLRSWFKFVIDDEARKATISTAIIVALATSILITPLSASIVKIAEKTIETFFEDKEVKELEKEKLKLEIEKLKKEINKNFSSLNHNTVIKKKKSNYFELLQKYPKVESVSFVTLNEKKLKIREEESVNRENFDDYILASDELEPVEMENITIEIISPVLKKGTFKWMGIYNGNIIHFNMRSNDFKLLIQSGKVQFKNGTAINCDLIIRKKIDSEGVEKIISYDVIRVKDYFENNQPIETPEGKKHRQKKEAERQQLDLFKNNPDFIL